MARINVHSQLVEFNSRLDKSLLLARDALGFREMRGGSLRQLSRARINQINELAFLGMYLAWESFIEASFIRFMCGAVTRTRYSPKLYVAPTSLEHALSFFVVRPRDYVEWSSGQQVIERAEMVFKDGEPYKSAIRPSLTDLDHMQKIRNVIAHRSESAREKFEKSVRDMLGARPHGLTPGLFLSLPHASGRPYVEHYKDVLSVVASRIIR